jgi:hypothetical protein
VINTEIKKEDYALPKNEHRLQIYCGSFGLSFRQVALFGLLDIMFSQHGLFFSRAVQNFMRYKKFKRNRTVF